MGNFTTYVGRMLTHNPLYHRGLYIITCKKVGFYESNQQNLINKLLLIYYRCRKNMLGEKLHIELGVSEFGRRLKIYHNDIIV